MRHFPSFACNYPVISLHNSVKILIFIVFHGGCRVAALWLLITAAIVAYASLRGEFAAELLLRAVTVPATRAASRRGAATGKAARDSPPSADLHALATEHLHGLRKLPRNCSVFVESIRTYARWRSQTIQELLADGDEIAAAAARHIKFVVVGRFGGGLGDRLPFMLSALAFSMRYGRLFFIDWPPLSKYVHSPFLDWHLDSLPRLASKVAATQPTITYSCENPGAKYPCLFGEEYPNATFSDELLHVTGNRGTWSSGSLRPHMSWYRDEIIDGIPGCAYQAMFQPRPELWARAQPVLDRFEALRRKAPSGSGNFTIIGFHYRSGDEIMHGDRNFTVDDMEAGWAEQLRLCASTHNSVVFLLSDSAQLRADAIRRFGADRIITTDLIPRHVGDVEMRSNSLDEEETVAVALTEWLLLSRTDFIVVGRMASGFAKLAVLASSHARIAYSQVMQGQSLGDCKPNAVSRTRCHSLTLAANCSCGVCVESLALAEKLFASRLHHFIAVGSPKAFLFFQPES